MIIKSILRIFRRQQYTISELPFGCVEMSLWNHSYENKFSLWVHFPSKSSSFSQESFWMKTCFETEAQGNSEMPQLEVSFGVESSFNASVSIKEGHQVGVCVLQFPQNYFHNNLINENSPEPLIILVSSLLFSLWPFSVLKFCALLGKGNQSQHFTATSKSINEIE